MIDINLILRLLEKIWQQLSGKGRKEKKIEKRYKKKLKEIDEAVAGRKNISVVTDDFLSRDDQPISMSESRCEGDRDRK